MSQIISDLLAAGLERQRLGQLSEAQRLYEQILAQEPDHIDALHLLGVLHMERGQNDSAATLIEQAFTALVRLAGASNPVAAPLLTNLGNALQKLGRTKEAADRYRKALRLQPNIAETHSNLGNLLDAEGDYQGAVSCYRRAIALNPKFGNAWFNLSNVLLRLKQPEEAAESYRKTLDLQPEMIAANLGLARALMALSQFEEARNLLDPILSRNPDSAPALSVRTRLSLLAGEPAEALAWATRAVLNDAGSAEAHALLGDCLEAIGEPGYAMESYQRSVTLRPDFAEAWFSLGRLAQAASNTAAAIGFYEQAVSANPGLAEAWFNLGNAFHKQDRYADAVTAYEKALAIRTDYAEAHAGRGTVLQKLGRLEEGISSLERALSLKPDFADAHFNLGNALEDLGRVDEAIASFGRAYEIKPEFVSAHFNQALAYLSKGDYVQGWRKYEYRWHPERRRLVARTFPQKLWLGEEPLTGRTILLHSEQGLGDTVQFCRYVQLVEAQEPRHILLEVQKPLVELLRLSFPSERVSVMATDPSWPAGHNLPHFDVHCPLLSLPLAFGTSLQSVPTPIPYLKTDANRRRYWGDRLATECANKPAGAFKVGLVWAGECRRDIPDAVEVDSRRSMKLAEFAALASLPEIVLVSLQKGEPSSQAKTRPFDKAMIDLMNEIESFADTAALIEALDLVISVDTSVAHVAAALGKPVWLLSRANGCWRWLLEGETSPWYPSLRVLRQGVAFEWQPIVR
jgi:tetratricopeptide (TPR) repeat protein